MSYIVKNTNSKNSVRGAISPEQSAIGRGGVERLVEGHDPVEELRREGQRRHGGQEAVVAKFAGFHAASAAAAAACGAAVASRIGAAANASTATGGHHAVALGHQPARFHHKLGPLTHFLKQRDNIKKLPSWFTQL